MGGGSTDAGITTDLTLNGAQISAVVDVITQLRQEMIVRDAALELLVAVGIPRDRAEVIVDKTAAAPKLKPENDTPRA